MKKLALVFLVACGSSSKPAPAPATPTTHPATLDDAAFAKLVTGPTDWSSFVSAKHGVVLATVGSVKRQCGDDAVKLVRETAAAMKGAACKYYESDGVECAVGSRTMMFDKDGDTWSAFGVLIDRDKIDEATGKQYDHDVNVGECR